MIFDASKSVLNVASNPVSSRWMCGIEMNGERKAYVDGRDGLVDCFENGGRGRIVGKPTCQVMRFPYVSLTSEMS